MLSIDQRNTVDKLLGLSGNLDRRYEVVPCNPSGNNRVFEIRIHQTVLLQNGISLTRMIRALASPANGDF